MNKRNQDIFDPPPPTPKIRTNVDYAWQLRITYLIKSNEIFSFISFDSMLCHDVIVGFQIIYKKKVSEFENMIIKVLNELLANSEVMSMCMSFFISLS